MTKVSTTTRIALSLILCLCLLSISGCVQSETGVSTDNTTTSEVTTTDEVSETDVELEEATVVRVVDGDTLVVDLSGEDYYVRLIGVDTPESVHPDASRNTEEGEDASEYTKSLVECGSTVYLQKDTSDTDTYDRLLRYVWLEEPEDVWDEEEVTEKMLNAILVINGYAEPKAYEPDTAYAEVFELLSNA